ncbi:hypothetical protein D3C81_1135200 [compost metagenome]
MSGTDDNLVYNIGISAAHHDFNLRLAFKINDITDLAAEMNLCFYPLFIRHPFQ